MSMLGAIGSIAGGIIGAYFGGPWGAAAGASVGGALGGKKDNNKMASMQRREAAWQNLQQLGFWQMNNDYNSPKSVMSRLEEAGLNPNLVYENGGANYQATMPTAAKSGFKYDNNINPMLFQQLENMESQNELLKAQKDNAFWQAGLNQNNASIANANANIAHFKEDYARREHEIFKKTGRIPESYHRSSAEGELTGIIRDGLMNLILQ